MAEPFLKLQNLVEELPFGKKIALLFLITACIAGIILMVVWAQRPDMQALYSNLSIEDSADIVSRLQQQKIPFEVTANGKTILVPSKSVYKARMQFAAEGVPQGGSVGFEIFDKTNFGATDFVQKLNFNRALQGELERTINNLLEVEHSRIHVVTPEKSLFIEDQKKPTASVMLKLKGGRKLKQSQVQGIVHLVASSVEGLNPTDITVVDVHGEMLYGGQSESTVGRLTNSQYEYKQNLEKQKELRVQSMLERVVGPHNAIVRVSADLNLKQIKSTQEIFDPNSQVSRSEQRTEETSQGGGGNTGGVVGLESNIPGEGGGSSSGGGGQSQRTKETINYEINKVVKQVVEPVGEIKKLSVSVVVNGKYEEEGEKSVYKARTDEEMQRYLEIVKASVGYDEKRGDVVNVENIEFNVMKFDKEDEALAKAAKKELYLTYGRYALAAVIVLILIFYIIKPLLNWVTQAVPESPLQEITESKINTQMAGPAREDLVDIASASEDGREYRKRVQELAESDPDRTAELLRKWLT